MQKKLVRFLMGDWLVWFAALFVLCLIVGVAVWLQPRYLVVAASQSDQESLRIVQALGDALARERSSVRLTPLWSATQAESVQAFNGGKADLLVARSDAALMSGSTSIMNLRRFYPVVLTRKSAKIAKFSELQGKRIGVGGQTEQNTTLLRQMLSHWGVPETAVTVVPLQRGELADAAIAGKIDAFFAVASPRIRLSSGGIEVLRKVWGKDLVVLAFDDAEALALRIRGVEAGELVKGFFGGEPAKPEEDTDSATLTNRLMANEKLGTHDAVTLTRALLALRDRRQADLPEVLGIETPSRDAPTLPVHPGTSQHLDGVYQDILDRYTNHIFIAAMGLGALGSIATALRSRQRRLRSEAAVKDLHYLIDVSDRLSQHTGDAQIRAELLGEVDGVFQRAMLSCAKGEISSGALAAIQAAAQRCHLAS
jgi:TRAP-type uncharacterized transport system substrate-binding protein